jgi:hypothetical protein
VPHVRTSVRGPKKTGRSPIKAFELYLSNQPKSVPHLCSLFARWTWAENDRASPIKPFELYLSNKRRVPHISLVVREMWDTTALNPSP